MILHVIVVIYHPEVEVLCNLISSVRGQVVKVWLVDNGGAAGWFDCAWDNVELVGCGSNLGVAEAYNVGGGQGSG